MGLPIIFLHRGPSEYMEYSLRKSSETNPSSEIFLIGDESNKKYDKIGENVNWIDIDEHQTAQSENLATNYKHFSTNPAHYEFVCIDRWFIINDFMKSRNMLSSFVTDTDVLLYGNVSNLVEKHFKTHRCTLTHNVSAGISFMNDRTILEDYIDLVLGSYGGKNKFFFDKAVSHWQTLQRNKRPGGVCDMTWWMFLRNNLPPFDFGESMSIIEEEPGIHSTFDHNINVSYGYEMENGMKKFKFKNGVPYCYNKTYDLDVKFNCIHFQGQYAKQFMRSFYEIK